MKIGVVGCGTMGSRIIKRLVEHGHKVFGFDPSSKAQEKAQDAGAILVEELKMFGECEIILLSLPKSEHVRAVLMAEGGILSTVHSAGTIIVNTSTVDSATNIEMSNEATQRGFQYLDAPILGRPATVGSWVMPTGGEESVFNAARPILEIIGRQAVLVGPVGSGTKLKLLNQLMFASINMVYCEVFSLAEKSGLGADLFYEVLADSGASTVSSLFVEIGRRITEDDFVADFSIDLLNKDIKLALNLLHDFSGEPIMTSMTAPLARLASASGYGAEDNAAIFRLFMESI